MSIGPESGGTDSPDHVTHGINHWRIMMFSKSANRLAHNFRMTSAMTTGDVCHLRHTMRGVVIAMLLAGPHATAQAQPVPAHQPAQVQAAQVQKIGIWHTNLNEARKEAERLNRPLLVHFGAVWCAPCQKMERTVFNQPEVIDQLKATAVCLKIDVDKNPELAQRFGVERFPTDVILEPNGMRLMEATGFQSPEEYRALVDRAARRYAVLLAARSNRPAAPVATTPETGGNPAQIVKNANAQLMLDGYCPVTLQNTRTWKKGDPQFQTTYKDQVYQFVSAEARTEFLQAPEKFVPQFLGCDPVLIFTTDRAVPGSIEWAAYFDNHLYLFVSQDNRSAFKSDPEKYLRTRVVLNVDQIESVFR
jgi:thiol-disulfide isomerase/thioredoxin/YHS domain-containing protein